MNITKILLVIAASALAGCTPPGDEEPRIGKIQFREDHLVMVETENGLRFRAYDEYAFETGATVVCTGSGHVWHVERRAK